MTQLPPRLAAVLCLALFGAACQPARALQMTCANLESKLCKHICADKYNSPKVRTHTSLRYTSYAWH